MIRWLSGARESGLLKYLEMVVLEKFVYRAISSKVIFFFASITAPLASPAGFCPRQVYCRIISEMPAPHNRKPPTALVEYV